jgi:hypothetical protein
VRFGRDLGMGVWPTQKLSCGAPYEYLSDKSQDLSSWDLYPHIRKLYISFNTGLPSSAAVERLFSLVGEYYVLCDLG